MTAKYPTSAWDGTAKNRDMDTAPFKRPDADDWNQVVDEVNAVQDRAGVGALVGTAGVGVTMVNDISGIQKIVLTLDEVSIDLADGGTKEYGSLKVADLGDNIVKVIGSVVDMTIARVGTSLSATADGDYALGSTLATDADLSGTQVDIHVKTTIAALTAGAGVVVGLDNEKVIVDHSTGDIFLNLIFDAGALVSGVDAVVVDGTITLLVATLGLYVNG